MSDATPKPRRPGRRRRGPGPSSAAVPAKSPASGPVPRRRWRRRIAWAGSGLLIAVVGSAYALTQTRLTRWIILPRVSAVAGLPVKAASVRVALDGSLVMRGVKAKVPGVRGQAANCVVIGSLRAEMDWSGLLGGTPRARRLTVDDVVVRVSQDTQTGLVTLGEIPVPAAGAGRVALPEIIADAAVLELGEHTGTDFRSLKRVPVAGSLRPITPAGADRAYGVELRETSPEAGRRPLRVAGRIDEQGALIVLTDFSLVGWGPDAVPARVREAYRRLDPSGAARVVLTYSDTAGVSARFELQDGAVNVPVPDPAGGPPNLVRMHRVAGPVTFDRSGVVASLSGLLADLPYEVSLRYEGLRDSSPFTCTLTTRDFVVDEHPDLLPFAPEIVQRRFRTFSGPTARIDAEVILSRAAPTADGPGRVSFRGELRLRDGWASYERFPYPFRDMAGLVRFDDEAIEIVEITGRADTGATLRATGRISPPDDGAEAELRIHIDGVPIDEQLRHALGPHLGQIVPGLFSAAQLDRLAAAGLVSAGPGQAPAAPGLPMFSLGGVGTVDVTLRHTALGPDPGWTNRIDVLIPEAGMLIDQFPLPVRATDLSIRVDDDLATITGGRFEGLSGGRADVSGTIRLSAPDGSPDFRPDVIVRAEMVPVDELFISALPGGRDPEAPGGLSPARLVRDLGVTGSVSATTRVFSGDDGLDVDAMVTIDHASLTPAADPRLTADGVGGSVRASRSNVTVDLYGQLRGADQPAGAGRVTVAGAVGFGDGAPPTIDATVGLHGVRLDAPLEAVVRVFSTEAADDIAALRATHRPAGTGDAVVMLDDRGDGLAVTAEVAGSSGLAFDGLDGRFTLGDSAGSIVFELGPRDRVEFRGFSAPLFFDQEPCGTLSIVGSAPVRQTADDRADDTASLELRLADAPIESGLLRRLVDRFAGEPAVRAWDQARPAGLADLRATVSPLSGPAGAPTEGPPARSPRLTLDRAVIEPRGLAFTHHGDRVLLTDFAGGVELNARSGRTTGLTARSGGATVEASGSWVRLADGSLSASGTLGVRSGGGLTPELLALAPRAVGSLAESLNLTIAGPVRVDEARWSYSHHGGAGLTSASFDGRVSVAGAAFEAGVAVADGTGDLWVSAEVAPGSDRPRVVVRAENARFTAAGVVLDGASAAVVSGDTPGVTELIGLSAWCHGGRVSGSARVTDDDGVARYEASVSLSNADFGSLTAGPPAGADQPGGAVDPPAPERGLLDGELTVAGVVGDDSSRRGRGLARVSGRGVRIVSFPLVLPLIEASNLQLPFNDPLDFASASFYIDGPMVAFEDLSVFSDSVSINGYGTISIPGRDLNLRFTSRAARRIPLVHRLLEGLRDELVATRVTGPLSDPAVSVEQFPTTRRIFWEAVGERPTTEDRRMNALQNGRDRNGVRASRPPRADSIPPSVLEQATVLDRDGPADP